MLDEQKTVVKFDYEKLLREYGAWIIVGAVAIYVLYSLQNKKGGGRPKVD